MSSSPPLKLYLSLTSSPSSPRVELSLGGNGGGGRTGSDLRKRASELTSVPLGSMKLIYRGRVIADKAEGDAGTEYGLEDGSVIHVVGKPVGAAAGATAGAGVAAGAGGGGPAGASVTLPSPSVPAAATSAAPSPLSAALATLRSSNDAASYKTALTTADKLLGNVVSHPSEEKYRSVKRANPAFSRRLGSLSGGVQLLAAAGFASEVQDGAEFLVLAPSADAWPKLVAAHEGVKAALAEVDSGGGAPPRLPAAGGPTGMPGVPGMPGMGALPGMEGADMSQVQNMLRDPAMLQNVMGMMNNPAVQNMMRSDPRFANNPMLQQSLNALQSNPDMMRQFSDMMSDPTAMERMARMMGGGAGGGVGGVGGSTGGPDPFQNGPEAMRRQMEQFQRATQQFGGASGSVNAGRGAGAGAGVGGGSGGAAPSSSGNGGGGSDDSQMTEEEMIAEAIARSLRES